MGMFNNLVNSPELKKMFGLGDGGGEVGNNAPNGYTYNPDTQTYTAKAKGGKVMSASKRADGIAQRGKTRGKIVMCGGGMYKK